MQKLVLVALTLFALGFTACGGDDDSGYVAETRKPQDYASKTSYAMEWEMLERSIESGLLSLHIPKSYKGEKANTQPPFMMVAEIVGITSVYFETERRDEIQSVKVDGGKCKITETERSLVGLSVATECSAKSISKIEIDTSLGKFTYKF